MKYVLKVTGGNELNSKKNKYNSYDDEVIDISEQDDWTRLQRNESDEGNDSPLSSILELSDETELTVTAVQKLKKPKWRYRIVFGQYSIDVHEDIMIKYRMLQGAVFCKGDLEDIVAADEQQQTYADALSYLARKSRTAYEIVMRLREKGWGETAIESSIERLSNEGFIDDTAYAQQWANQRVKSKAKGKLWVKQELRQKGISKPLIEDALNSISEEEEFESALQLAIKKWNQTSGERIDKQRKTGAFLMRRGYSGSLVSRVLREVDQENTT